MDKELIAYFVNETNKKFEKLEKKIDQLLSFKYQVIGIATLSSILVSIIVTIGVAFIKQG